METRETFPKAGDLCESWTCPADVEAGTVEEREETANTRTSCGVYFKLNAQGHAEVESILERSSADDHNAACRRQGRMAARIQPGHLLLAIDDQPCVALCSVRVCLSDMRCFSWALVSNAWVYVCSLGTLNALPKQAKDLRERLLGPSGTCVKLHLSGPRPYSVLLVRGGSGECVS